MKRISIICMVMVLALAMMGFGFAKWSDTVAVSHSVSSGEVKIGFAPESYMCKDVGPDWTVDIGDFSMLSVQNVPENKDVGSTTGSFSDTDSDGTLDLLTVTTTNAYPYYYNEVSSKILVEGSIPVKLEYAELDWMGNEHTIRDGQLYMFLDDGQVVEYNYWAGDTVPANAVIEFCWMNNAGNQFHPGDRAEESYEFMVLQPAAQNETYTFGISVQGTQWNENNL